MFHKAIDLSFGKGTVLYLTFQTGEIKKYDMKNLFDKYPSLKELKNRTLFLSGRLVGNYGVIWNDDLDIEAETVYDEGITVGSAEISFAQEVGNVVYAARNRENVTQKVLAELTGIDQSDISKIERGLMNPSINTLKRIADALGTKVHISI